MQNPPYKSEPLLNARAEITETISMYFTRDASRLNNIAGKGATEKSPQVVK